MMRRKFAGIIVTGLLIVTAGSAAADSSSTGPYAPLNRPGPLLRVPAKDLAASLHCSPGVDRAARTPVLLVPGTTLDPESNFDWNYERAFTAQHRPWCAVRLPEHATGNIQIAGEYVVSAIRTMRRRANRRIDILGYSQGGMVPRWALRFWPDTRNDVVDFVALDPSNHGTVDADALCTNGCDAANWEQGSKAIFMQALNSGAETFAGIDYTVVFSRTDEVVVPNVDAAGSSSLHTGKGRIANIAVQDVCPNDVSEHLAMGSYDPVGYALAVDAFDNDGPAAASRIALTTCSQPFQPGVALPSFPSDFSRYLLAVGNNSASAPTLAREPALMPYVFADRRP